MEPIDTYPESSSFSNVVQYGNFAGSVVPSVVLIGGTGDTFTKELYKLMIKHRVRCNYLSCIGPPNDGISRLRIAIHRRMDSGYRMELTVDIDISTDPAALQTTAALLARRFRDYFLEVNARLESYRGHPLLSTRSLDNSLALHLRDFYAMVHGVVLMNSIN